MKGDFSRQTFRKEKHYSGVLMQQGRVQVDADWNEQQAIQQYRAETEAADVIGPTGAPADEKSLTGELENKAGFEITVDDTVLRIGHGRYYVDGILCETDQGVKLGEKDVPLTYQDQPDLPNPRNITEILDQKIKVGLVYLKVWRRHITSLEDQNIREVALGGPDTATRMKTVWQVHIFPIKVGLAKELADSLQSQAKLQKELENHPSDGEICAKLADIAKEIDKLLNEPDDSSPLKEWKDHIKPSDGGLTARVQEQDTPTGPCIVPPRAGYRGLENQLYRVEIHDGGRLDERSGKVSFKWSRDNGSVVTKCLGQSGEKGELLTVASTGRDRVLGFSAGQWVELIDDTHELNGEPGTVVRIVSVDGDTLTIDPSSAIPKGHSVKLGDFSQNPKVRRWDSLYGVEKATVAKPGKDLIKLEDNIEVGFHEGTYRSGDYWLIPARTEDGKIEWPYLEKEPQQQPPSGITYHYSPLALIYLDRDKLHAFDLREVFPALTGLVNFRYVDGEGQEASPDKLELPEPLKVGVFAGHRPMPKQTVLFQQVQGDGQLRVNKDWVDGPVVAVTGENGIAACDWRLGKTPHHQVVQATLLDKNCRAVQTPILFHAYLAQPGGLCTVVLGSDGVENLKQAIERIPPEGGCICIPIRNWRQTEPVEIAKKRNVTIKGCGPGSLIQYSGKERPLFTLNNVADIIFQDFAVELDAEKVGPAFSVGKVSGPISIEGCVIKSKQRGLKGVTLSKDCELKDGLFVRNNRFSLPNGTAVHVSEGVKTLSYVEIVGNKCECSCLRTEKTAEKTGYLPDAANVVAAHNHISSDQCAVEVCGMGKDARILLTDNQIEYTRRKGDYDGAIKIMGAASKLGAAHITSNIVRAVAEEGQRISDIVHVGDMYEDPPDEIPLRDVLFSNNKISSESKLEKATVDGFFAVELSASRVIAMGNYVEHPQPEDELSGSICLCAATFAKDEMVAAATGNVTVTQVKYEWKDESGKFQYTSNSTGNVKIENNIVLPPPKA